MDLPSRITGRDVVLAVGTFDGVHLGHRYLVQQVVRRAGKRGCLSGAITFHPQPRSVVTGQGVPYLSTLDERLALLRGLGLDVVVAVPFNRDLARLSALDFMSSLCESVGLRELWVGSDFALGYRREGTVPRLTEIGHSLDYEVHGVPPLALHGQTVSSTLIRELVRQGQVEGAAHLLGRRHHVSGIAMRGDQRDQQLGLPTATMIVSDGLALPASGSYLGGLHSEDRRWWTTVRVEPSLTGSARQLELSVPGFPDHLCGQSLRVEFVHRLCQGVPTQRVRVPTESIRAQSPVLSPV